MRWYSPCLDPSWICPSKNMASRNALLNFFLDLKWLAFFCHHKFHDRPCRQHIRSTNLSSLKFVVKLKLFGTTFYRLSLNKSSREVPFFKSVKTVTSRDTYESFGFSSVFFLLPSAFDSERLDISSAMFSELSSFTHIFLVGVLMVSPLKVIF